MKLSLAVFCLINQVSAACDFQTDIASMTFNPDSKGKTSAAITVTSPADGIVRIQAVTK